MLWSMLVNVGLFVGLSLTGRRKSAEHVQASTFVDVFTRLGGEADPRLWRGTVTVRELQALLGRFLGPEGARAAFESYADRTGTDVSPAAGADADLVHHVETLLTGAVGSASARFMVASVVDEEPLAVSEVVQILDETSQVLAYSRALERKSEQLELATSELREANSRLQELDRLKDDFVSTISHELRTPLTSIRAFSEILMDNPDLDPDEREGYLRIVVDETERLTRLINQVLDLSKLESGSAEWQIEHVDLGQVLTTSMQATAQIFRERRGCPRDGRTRACAGRAGRRGPARPGDAQPPLERREVLPAGVGPGAGRRRAARRRRPGRRLRQRTRHRRRGPRRHLREVPSGRRHPDQPSVGHGARDCRSADRSWITSAAGSGWRAPPGRALRSPSNFRSRPWAAPRSLSERDS